MESLKSNKEIKGLPKYVGEHILPVLDRKTDQIMKCVLKLLSLKYGQTRTEKMEEIVEDWMKFCDNQHEDNGELLLDMKELNQRRKELKMTDDEWIAVWMLSVIRKRKKIDKFAYQALRDVVKLGGDDIVKNFEEKFKEL